MTEKLTIEIARNVRLTGDHTNKHACELQAADGATLPALCVDCGVRVESGSPDVRVYRGFAPGAWWLFLIKAGTRALVIRLFGRKIRVGAYVCEQHVSRRATKRIVGFVMLLLALPLLAVISLAKVSSGLGMLIFGVWTIAGFIIRWGGTDLLSAKGVTAARDGFFEMPSREFMEAAAKQPWSGASAELAAARSAVARSQTASAR